MAARKEVDPPQGHIPAAVRRMQSAVVSETAGEGGGMPGGIAGGCVRAEGRGTRHPARLDRPTHLA